MRNVADRSIALRIREVVLVQDRPVPPPQPIYPGAGIPTWFLATIAARAVSQAFNVESLLLKARKRGARRLAHARAMAMALVHLVAGRSQEDVARAFKRNRTTASNHMEMTEALLDVPEMEEFWQLLERRFVLLITLSTLSNGRYEWLKALKALERALDEGELEGEAVDQARYISRVHWEDRLA